MIRRMPLLNRDEDAVTGCTHLVIRHQLPFDYSAVIGRLDNASAKADRRIERSRTLELDRILRRDSAGGSVCPALLHQMMRRRPIQVTVEKRSDDPSVQHAGERLMMFLRTPFTNVLITLDEASDSKPLLVRTTASEADALRCICFLQGFLTHAQSIADSMRV